jgi:hypothetical protein
MCVKVFSGLWDKKFNSKRLIKSFLDFEDKPIFSSKKFFKFILKFLTLPPYKKPLDQ